MTSYEVYGIIRYKLKRGVYIINMYKEICKFHLNNNYYDKYIKIGGDIIKDIIMQTDKNFDYNDAFIISKDIINYKIIKKELTEDTLVWRTVKGFYKKYNNLTVSSIIYQLTDGVHIYNLFASQESYKSNNKYTYMRPKYYVACPKEMSDLHIPKHTEIKLLDLKTLLTS